MNPGNSGGGKAPDFWHAFEEGKDRVIGDKPANTANDRKSSEKALRRSKGEEGSTSPREAQTALVSDLSGKPLHR
jgi:hypothetical protein